MEQPHHLLGKRDNVGPPHLHAFWGDNPFGGVKVYFLPCRAAQFSRTYKDIGENAQGMADGWFSMVGIYCLEQMSQVGRRSDSGVMLGPDRCKSFR